MFYFVVHHLRWLARLPLLPQLFDTMLLAHTCVFRHSRFLALQELESEALRLPGVEVKVHRYGGIEFVDADGRELGHVHGHGLLDAPVGRETADSLNASGNTPSHHVFPKSKWVSFQLESPADVPFAMQLLTIAGSNIGRPL